MLPIDPVLTSILVFGAWASYDDIRHGKIRNACVILMIITGLAINIFITKSAFLLPFQTASNMAFSILAAMVLWWARLWSAGDAKLFIGFSSIIPVTAYGTGLIFPGIALIRDSFIPILVALVVIMLLKTSRKQKMGSLKKVMDMKVIAEFALRFSSLYLLGGVLSSAIGISLDIFTWSLVIFAILFITGKVTSVGNNFFLSIAILSAIAMHFMGILGIETLINIASFTLIFFIFLIVFSDLGKHAFTKEISIKDMKEGMALAEMVVRDGKKYRKLDKNYISILSSMMQKNRSEDLFASSSSGLTKEDMKKLSSLEKEGNIGFNTIKVSDKMPFAPLILLGCLITYFSVFAMALSFL